MRLLLAVLTLGLFAGQAAHAQSVLNMADGVNSVRVGGVAGEYLSTLPTLSNGQATPLMVDSSGHLLVSGTLTGGGGSTQGTYNSSAPTLTSGAMSGLQLNVHGGLIVDGSAVTQPVSGAVSVSNFPVNGSGNLLVQAQDAATGSGSIAAAGTVFSLTGAQTAGYSSISVQLTSTGSGNTIEFQQAADGATWVTTPCALVTNNGGGLQSFLPAGGTSLYVCPLYGAFRLQVAAYGSGTISTAYMLRVNPMAHNPMVDQGAANQSGASWMVNLKPQTTGALTNYRINAAATTNATSVKTSAGVLYGYSLCNASASLRYVRLFNLATAPTVGTSTPTQTVILAANGGCVTLSSDVGVTYSAGIALDITGANGDSDTTAVSANDVSGALYYQ